LAHLAYSKTLPAPRNIKPEEGVFLEFAPIYRSWTKPLKEECLGDKAIEKNPDKQTNLYYLKENLEVFPAETAVVLNYWLDVSPFSDWKKPAVQLPWNREVFLADLETYLEYGIRNVTSFATCIDNEYLEAYPDMDFLVEYGEGLNRCAIGPLTNPWGDYCAPTDVNVYCCGDSIHFSFDVTDLDLVYAENYSYERDIEVGDRVEIFFSKDAEMKDYVGFEIDPLGNILTYKCSYYRQFDFSWEPQHHFDINADITDKGYIVEVSIPMDYVNEFLQDSTLYLGIYRGDFYRENDQVVERWYSWKNPMTEEPDFHVPSSLERVILKK
jgi:hypothetical protein